MYMLFRILFSIMMVNYCANYRMSTSHKRLMIPQLKMKATFARNVYWRLIKADIVEMVTEKFVVHVCVTGVFIPDSKGWPRQPGSQCHSLSSLLTIS